MAATSDMGPDPTSHVIDIGGSKLPERLKASFNDKLVSKSAKRPGFLPDIFFSDDTGLKLWEAINRLPDYYQTCDEVELLEKHGPVIASSITTECTIIDLGCGDIRKIVPLLDSLHKTGRSLQYYALDLSYPSVEASVRQIRKLYPSIRCHGLWGSFEDGFEWAKTIPGPKLFLSLGSIFGNDYFERATHYLALWRSILKPEDRMLIGIDGCQDLDTVWRSYHDENGLFDEFIRNGFRFSNTVAGNQWYRDEDWEVVGVLNRDPLMHRFVLRATKEVDFGPMNLHFAAGEEIECYEGWKIAPQMMRKQFEVAGLEELGSWRSATGRIGESLFTVLIHSGALLLFRTQG